MKPGMPRMPGFGDAMKMMQAQTELLAELPSMIAELQRAVRGLSDVLAATKETVESAQRVSLRLEATLDEIEEPAKATVAHSRETVKTAQQVTSRVDAVVDEIEGPVLALRPGLERLAVVLNSAAIDRVPTTLEAIEQTVLPVAAALERTRSRWRAVTSPARRLVRRSRIRSS